MLPIVDDDFIACRVSLYSLPVVYPFSYVIFLTLLPLWLLVRPCSRLGEESDGDDVDRVDVDAEE